MHRAIASVITGAVLLMPAVALAEPTSWLAFGPGVSLNRDHLDHLDSGTIAISGELGLGSDPSHPFVIGGVFRSLANLDFGVDLSLSARLATSSFARGNWGVALDLGVAARWWGEREYGRYPLQAVGILGLPGGLQLELGTELGDVTGATPTTAGGFLVIAADIFRLLTKTSSSQKSFFGSEPPPSSTVTFHDFGPAPAPSAPPP